MDHAVVLEMYPFLDTLVGRIERTQVPAFGTEIRGLLDQERATEKEHELAGIVINEIEALVDAKSNGKSHPKEERLGGPTLRDISYLKLYVSGQSVRVYFTIQEGRMWMLHLEPISVGRDRKVQ
jgi:hypothetical protein